MMSPVLSVAWLLSFVVHAGTPAKVSFAVSALTADPIPPAQVLEGKPQARLALLGQEGGRVSGLWECTPGRFRWDFPADEFVYFISGAATIAWEDGTSITLKAGDYARLPKGKATWTIRSRVRKTFVYGP